MDEVMRQYVIPEATPMYYEESTNYTWWYLRILRWMKLSILYSFKMRWFYEPVREWVSYFYKYKLLKWKHNESIRLVVGVSNEVLRDFIPPSEENLRSLVTGGEEVMRR